MTQHLLAFRLLDSAVVVEACSRTGFQIMYRRLPSTSNFQHVFGNPALQPRCSCDLPSITACGRPQPTPLGPRRQQRGTCRDLLRPLPSSSRANTPGYCTDRPRPCQPTPHQAFLASRARVAGAVRHWARTEVDPCPGLGLSPTHQPPEPLSNPSAYLKQT